MYGARKKIANLFLGIIMCSVQSATPPQTSAVVLKLSVSSGVREVSPQYPPGGATCQRCPKNVCRTTPITIGWVEIPTSETASSVRSTTDPTLDAASIAAGIASMINKAAPPRASQPGGDARGV